MAGFSFDNGGRRCIRPILEKYQSGKGSRMSILKHDWHETYFFFLTKGESEGYTVRSREEEFPISNYPLEQTEFFYSQKQGIASLIIFISLTCIYISFEDRSKTANLSFIRACSKGRDNLGHEKNKVFDYSMFNYRNGRTPLIFQL